MYWYVLRGFQVLTCCVSFICVAQDSTQVLDEVEIVGIDLSRFSSGTIIKSIKGSTNGSLADIGSESAIYFKNYGSQQLSTISLRGTSASQTSVIWNGIPVNSPTLGQTDFSVWPMFLTDQLLVQKGGGSSLFGSGAIGGTVIIDNSKVQRDSIVSVYLGYGSFGQRDGGLKIQLQHQKLTNETSIYRSVLENDFKLEDGSKQEHAAVKHLGISNKLKYEYARGRLFAEMAFAENDRDIQPTRTSASRSTLKTKNTRAVLDNELFGKTTHRSTLGFVSDQTIFNDSSITTSYRLAATHAIERSFYSTVFLRLGGTGIHEWARSENFENAEKQTQGHLFASGTISNQTGSVTLNLRQAFYRSDIVFVPSLGIESGEIGYDGIKISFRSQVSRDYRTPTFNDLFWRPGGNPDLAPERSLNYELGTDLKISNLSLGVTAFTSRISNWIQWTPNDGIWSPQNIREVQTKGVDLDANASLKLEKCLFSVQGEYSYTLSSDKELAEKNQLPYVPKHSAIISMGLSWSNSSVVLTGNYTGERYTTLSNSRANRIDDFFLTDFRLSQNILLKSVFINASFSIQNMLNVDYENLKNTAMPGRAFLIQLTTKI